MVEKLSIKDKPIWGFPYPTLLIDSQSAPVLRAVEAEQVYYRMFLMGKPTDKAVVNYDIDPDYITYLQNTLQVPIPEIVKISNQGTGFLTGDILSQSEVISYLEQLVQRDGYKMQFFNLTSDELTLAKKLGNPTYVKDLDAAERLGTKNGFREFCYTNGIPMPIGAVCRNGDQVVQAIEELNGQDIIIKSWAGTGGAELGSNVKITREQLDESECMPELLLSAMSALVPADPPYVVEQHLYLPEASLHIFLDHNGEVVIQPQVFGQFAHEGSYIGGHFPNGFSETFNDAIKALTQNSIIPALKRANATGMHCMDFLYDEKAAQFYFIEDNTRPGALDFISHFVSKVAATHHLVKPAWYHFNLPLAEIAGKRKNTFEEVSSILRDILSPGELFALISNPNVLPFGGSLHLTGVSTGEHSSAEKAKFIFEQAVAMLCEHYGYHEKISFP